MLISKSFSVIPSLKITTTNMQYVATRSSGPIFPYDTAILPPITNPCTPQYIGSTIKGGRVEFALRSTGFVTTLSASIMFIPSGTNVFKPFVTPGKIGEDGVLRPLMSQEEFEKSQQ